MSSQGDGRVDLVGATRYSVEAHAEGGWPEFVVQLRYLVATDDPVAGEQAAREFFESTDWRASSDDTSSHSARDPLIIHGHLQDARGYLVDEDYVAVEATLQEAVEAAKDLEAERDRYRDLLGRILASLRDGTIDVPDVARAVEAEIKEALNA